MGYLEWIDRLKELDPDEVVDLLGVSSDEIVEKFEDKLEEIWRLQVSDDGEL